MQVIFTKDLPGVAKANDLKEVANGYAYNFLFPKGIAHVATAESIAKAEAAKANAIAKKEDLILNAKEIATKLKGLTLTFLEKTSEEGHLYGAIAEKDILTKVLEEAKIELEKKNIKMKKHIKEVGEHEVEIKLPEGLSVKVKVIVKSEK